MARPDRAALEAQIAELQAQLAAMEEPDPLLIEAREIAASFSPLVRLAVLEGNYDGGDYVRIALAALRRGMELQREAPRPVVDDAQSKWKVPAGQTPLDDNLRHRLLDVIREGSDAFDSKANSPYHGHSLEHCLHATGWVQRDLRLALDAALERIATLSRAPLASPPWPGEVECVEKGCCASGPTPATEAEAIAAWNTRHTAQSDALAVMREAREALEAIRAASKQYLRFGKKHSTDYWRSGLERIDSKSFAALTKLTAAIKAMGEG